jgi:uncharacterized protein (DUF1697 family)
MQNLDSTRVRVGGGGKLPMSALRSMCVEAGFVFCPRGVGRSKLKIPAAKGGTARNMNTIAALVAMAGA